MGNRGRAAAGLDPNTKDFAILPPRFKDSVVQALPNNAWSDVVVGYDSLEDHVKPVVEMLILTCFLSFCSVTVTYITLNENEADAQYFMGAQLIKTATFMGILYTKFYAPAT